MSKIYKLDFKHPTHVGFEEISIGFFSSYEIIDKIIEDRMSKPGFCLYPRSCFIIKEIIVDEYSWKMGFTKETNKDTKIT